MLRRYLTGIYNNGHVNLSSICSLCIIRLLTYARSAAGSAQPTGNTSRRIWLRLKGQIGDQIQTQGNE